MQEEQRRKGAVWVSSSHSGEHHGAHRHWTAILHTVRAWRLWPAAPSSALPSTCLSALIKLHPGLLCRNRSTGSDLLVLSSLPSLLSFPAGWCQSPFYVGLLSYPGLPLRGKPHPSKERENWSSCALAHTH